MAGLSGFMRAVTAACLVAGFAVVGVPTAAADPIDILDQYMSKGYTADLCPPQTPDGGALAVVECGDNPDNVGPISARYALYANTQDLNKAFDAAIGPLAQTVCGESKSPTVWRPSNNSADAAGKVACGAMGGQSQIIWTSTMKEVLSTLRGPDSNTSALYQWWLTKG